MDPLRHQRTYIEIGKGIIVTTLKRHAWEQFNTMFRRDPNEVTDPDSFEDRAADANIVRSVLIASMPIART